MRLAYFFMAILFFVSMGCWDSNYFDIEVEAPDAGFAFPIASASANVVDIAEQNSDQVSVRLDEEGNVMLFYRGDFLSQTANEIFPPLPLLMDFAITEEPTSIPLPIVENLNVSRAIFRTTSVRFKVSTEEDLERLVFKLPGIRRDGSSYEREFEVSEMEESDDLLITPSQSLDGWEIVTEDNQIIAEYDAFDAEGNSLTLTEAFINIDFIAFSYVEGDLGERIFDLEGTNISIGIFKNWLSGGFSFDEPRIILDIANSFGLPMNAIFNKMELVTINGNILPIESDIIDQGLSFNFPSLDEVGEVKFSQIVFDSNNSNLEEIFNEKAVAVNFDIDAFANPPGSEIETGFLTSNSFYNVDAVVELPLRTRIDDLVLGDTVTIDFMDLENVQARKIRLAIQNSLPIDIELKTFFINSENDGVDYLHNDNWGLIRSADNSELGTDQQTEQILEYELDEGEWESIKQSKRLALQLRLNTPDDSQEYFWIQGHQGINLQLSAVASIE